jgi:hypothetical protein
MGVPALLQGISSIHEMVLRGQGKGMLAALNRRRKGGAISHMGNFPLLQRPIRYAQGGKMIKNLIPYITRATQGGTLRPKRRGRGPIADVLSKIPLLGMIAGPIASAFGAGRVARRGMGGTYVRPHISHTKYGAPIHVKGYRKTYHSGMGLLAPAGGKARYVPGGVVRAHRVRPHISHTKYGAPVFVKGYRTGKRQGMGLLMPAGGPRGGYLPYATSNRHMLSVY